jgi:predicted dehydrogenase
VDLIRYFGGDVVEVACFKDAFLPRVRQVETEDTALAIFRFASGAIGKVHCCVGPIAPFSFNFKLFGTQGTVVNNRVWLDTIPRFADPGHENDCITLPANWIPDNVQGGISEPWNKLMDHFIDMLTADASCLNDVHSAYQTSLACFAALEAARTGRVIKIKEME